MCDCQTTWAKALLVYIFLYIRNHLMIAAPTYAERHIAIGMSIRCSVRPFCLSIHPYEVNPKWHVSYNASKKALILARVLSMNTLCTHITSHHFDLEKDLLLDLGRSKSWLNTKWWVSFNFNAVCYKALTLTLTLYIKTLNASTSPTTSKGSNSLFTQIQNSLKMNTSY